MMMEYSIEIFQMIEIKLGVARFVSSRWLQFAGAEEEQSEGDFVESTKIRVEFLLFFCEK